MCDSKLKNLYIDYYSIELYKDKDIEYKEEDVPNSINAYESNKLEGENYAKDILKNKFYIARISWVFGETGNDFIETMLKLLKTKIINCNRWSSRKSNMYKKFIKVTCSYDREWF